MAKLIDLRSDTVTRPTPAMREAMAQAEVGDDVFGEDPSVNRLQEMGAAATGKEAALFVPSGIMANQLAIRAQTQPGDEVILESQAHIFHYEAGAGGALSGVQFYCLEGRGGILQADQVRAAIRTTDYYLPPTRLICLENTHNRAGGTVYPLDAIEAIRAEADRHGLSMHLDGARLFNACVSSGLPPSRYSRYFDTVSFCLSKGLGAPVGSLICGSKALMARIRRLRRMFGGGMRQAGILAAAGIYALKHHVERLAEDHRHARLLAEGLANLKGIRLDPETVQTNIVVLDIAGWGQSPQEAADRLRDRGVLLVPFGSTLLRAVTHLDVTQKDIQATLAAAAKVFR